MAYRSSDNGGDPDGYPGFLMLIGRGYPVAPDQPARLYLSGNAGPIAIQIR
ncbi:MAG: hypothetical protein IT210_15030 [Armatimonadetes bacterium]|nr:hypothetical protein [Armatimonadota bacterium]